MTTTLTLNDDLTRRIKELAEQHNLTFEQALERTIQQGLSEIKTGPKRPRNPFRQRTFDMGSFQHISYDKTSRILADLEEQALHDREQTE